MDNNYTLTQNVDTLFSNLESFTQSNGLIGKAVTHGDKTFIPIVSVTLGYGSGNTASKNQQAATSQAQSTNAANMAGGALGLGAKLNTEAILLIDNNNNDVSMLPMTGTNASQLMDKIPQIFSTMSQNKQQGQQQEQGQDQNQN